MDRKMRQPMNSIHEDVKAATTYWEYDMELTLQSELESLRRPPVGYYYAEDPWTDEIREMYRESKKRTEHLREAPVTVAGSLVGLVMSVIVPAVIFWFAVWEIAAIDDWPWFSAGSGELPLGFPWFTAVYPVKIIGCGILAVWPDRWGRDVLTWTYIRIWGATRIHLKPGRMALNGCGTLFLATVFALVGSGMGVV